MTQVFISYSRKDLEFVDRLANDLKSTGFEVWYDLSGLEPGTRWRQEIQKAIQDSQYFLVVLSPNSIISDWVEREFLFASDQDMKIIPLLYQPCTLPMWSLNLHFIDMQGKNYAFHYQELLKAMGVKAGSEENPIAIRYIEIGDEYRKRGQNSRAIESYQQALQVDPGNLKARTNIGAVHLMGQEYSQAVEAYELAMEISPEDRLARAGLCDANMALGNQARAEGRIAEAIRYYTEILRIDADEPNARRSLVNIHTSRVESLLAAGQENEALAEYAELVKYGPEDPGLASRLEKMRAEKRERVLNEWMARSEVEISTGNWNQALVVLNEALEIEPQERSILKKIEDIKQQQLQGQLESLLSKVEQAEKEQHWDAALAGLKEYLQLKPEDEAIQTRMADLMQSKHEAWLNAVVLRVDQSLADGNWDAALGTILEAIQLEPDNKELLNRAARIKKDQHTAKLDAILIRADQSLADRNWDAALGIIHEAIQLDPDNKELHARAARIKKDQHAAKLDAILMRVDQSLADHNWDAALETIHEAIQLEPDNKELPARAARIKKDQHAAKLDAILMRADQSLADRNWDAALETIKEAIQLDPDNKELHARAARIKKDQHAAKLNAILMRADQAASASRWEDALEILNAALGSDPANPTLKSKLTETLKTQRKMQLQSVLNQVEAAERLGKWEDALAKLNQVLADEPDNTVFLERYNRILALERESKLKALRSRARTSLKEQKFEEAMAAWNEILLLAPEKSQDILAEIEAVNSAQKLEANYAEGVQAFAAKDYKKALLLFDRLQSERAGYKDTASLQTKTRKLLASTQKTTRPAGRRTWILAGVLLVLALGIGSGIYWLGKDVISPPASPTLVAEITGTSTATPRVPTPTPIPGILNPANQHQYLYVEDEKNWQDADAACAALGGYLVTIQDAAENQFVYDLSNGNTWLGASDELEDGSWSWVSGESFSFPNWAENQPDNDISTDANGENFLSFLPESPLKWNDHPNGNLPYTCEWGPSYAISLKFPQRQTITVTSVEDTGPGSLRQALLDARAGDIITFDPATFPPDNPVAINLYSGLPVIDQGYLTLDASNAGVVLNGSHAGGEWTAGIDLWSDHNIIQGMGVINFSGPGISLQTNSNFNTIGGDRAIGLGKIGQANFVGANSDGIAITGSDNVITGNLVGIIDVDAEDWELGNRAAGVFLAEKASHNTIGPNNIIAYNGTVAGCGIEFISLEARDNNLTANIIYDNKPDSAGICYNISPANQFVHSTPPTILFFELGISFGSAAGQTCPFCLVEIFSTSSQDARIFEGAVTANQYGNFVFYKSGELRGKYLTATTRSPGENTSELSLPTPKLTDIGIALNEAWVSKPYFGTSFVNWSFTESEIPISILEDGKLIITSESGPSSVEITNLSSDKLLVEFELSIRESGLSNSTCYLSLTNNAVGESLRNLGVGFRSSEPAHLQHYDALSQNWPVIAMGSKPVDLSKTKKVILVVVGNQIGVFIDRQIATTILDPDGSAVYSIQHLAAENSVVCEFDNYKLWDLSNVNFNP